MLDRLAVSSLGDTHKKLYAHYDYFGYVIPAVWFLVGSLIVELQFARESPIDRLLDETFAFLGEVADLKSVAFELVVAIAVLLLLFNLIYITGHLLNSTSALLMDRSIVKKILKYPFKLWLLRDELRSAGKGFARADDHKLFAWAVLDTSYFLTASANLFPWVVIEFGLVFYSFRQDHGQIHWAYSVAGATFLVGVLTYLHLGAPTRRAERLDLREEFGSFREIRILHGVLLILVVSLVTAAVLVFESLAPLLALVTLSALIVAGDRRMRREREYSRGSAKKFYFYLRSSFPNWIYFVANLVDYGSMPSRSVLTKAKACTGKCDGSSSDFFWLAYINLENRAPASFPAAYHFLSMYGMNRNLSTATGFILIHTGLSYFFNRLIAADAEVFVWVCTLLAFSLLFFVRYLYLYSGYYSKYIVRAAAYLEEARLEGRRSRRQSSSHEV